MLLQVPFALNASATDLDTLAANTTFTFDVQKADASDPGDIKIDLTVDGTDGELLSTIGATVVVDLNAFDLVDEDGNVVTSTYQEDSTTLPLEFGIDYGDLIGANAASIASYNGANEEMYIFVAGYLMVSDNQPGKAVANGSYLATLYLKTKGNAKPGADNLRVMRADEFRADCHAGGVYSAGFGATANDKFYVASSQVAFNLPQNGSITATNITSDDKSISADSVVTLIDESDATVAQTSVASDQFVFTDVEPGTYSITIEDAGALKFTIYNVVVAAGENTVIDNTVKILYGNVDGDDTIGVQDIGLMITLLDEAAPLGYDVDGDGEVTVQDIGIVLQANHLDVSLTQAVLVLA